MILKIQRSKQEATSWRYISNIEDVEVINGECAVAFGGRDEGGVPYLSCFGFSKLNTSSSEAPLTKEDKKIIDESSETLKFLNRHIVYPIELFIDEEDLLSQIGISKDSGLGYEGKMIDSEVPAERDPFWSIVLFDISYTDGKQTRIGVLTTQNCFLLNEAGQTIERL